MHAHVWGGDKQRAAPPLPVPLDAARMGVPSKYSILHGSLKGRLSSTAFSMGLSMQPGWGCHCRSLPEPSGACRSFRDPLHAHTHTHTHTHGVVTSRMLWVGHWPCNFTMQSEFCSHSLPRSLGLQVESSC
eukprot:1160883-Pelagomonas_calceolata.AAC.5